MVFGFFSRKAPTTSAPEAQQQLRTPSPSVDSASLIGKHESQSGSPARPLLPPPPISGASPPPITPSPPPDPSADSEDIDPATLHALIASVPPQTLHAYTLAHLLPPPPSLPLSPLSLPPSSHPTAPPNARTLAALAHFFRTLAPPPELHCVRCHKGYFEIENGDRSCLVPHDDDSALVERLGRGRSGAAEYETLWGCCAKTVEGDGDMGPPDGWCYEGRHTTDTKRARFRADSTPHDDKLTSCSALRCHDPLPARSRSTRKRRRSVAMPQEEESDDEDANSHNNNEEEEEEEESVGGRSNTSSNRRRAPKKQRTSTGPGGRRFKSKAMIGDTDSEPEGGEDAMDVDSPPQLSASVSSSPSPKRKPKPKPKPAKGKGKSKAALTRSPLSASFIPGSARNSPPPAPQSPSPSRRADHSPTRSGAFPVVEIVRSRANSPSKGSLKGQASSSSLKASTSSSSLKAAASSTIPSSSSLKPKPSTSSLKSHPLPSTSTAGHKPRSSVSFAPDAELVHPPPSILTSTSTASSTSSSSLSISAAKLGSVKSRIAAFDAAPVPRVDAMKPKSNSKGRAVGKSKEQKLRTNKEPKGTSKSLREVVDTSVDGETGTWGSGAAGAGA